MCRDRRQVPSAAPVLEAGGEACQAQRVMGTPSAAQGLSFFLTRHSFSSFNVCFLSEAPPFSFRALLASSLLSLSPQPFISLYFSLSTGFASHQPHVCLFNLHCGSFHLGLRPATASARVCPFLFPHPQSQPRAASCRPLVPFHPRGTQSGNPGRLWGAASGQPWVTPVLSLRKQRQASLVGKTG